MILIFQYGLFGCFYCKMFDSITLLDPKAAPRGDDELRRQLEKVLGAKYCRSQPRFEAVLDLRRPIRALLRLWSGRLPAARAALARRRRAAGPTAARAADPGPAGRARGAREMNEKRPWPWL